MIGILDFLGLVDTYSWATAGWNAALPISGNAQLHM